MGGDGQPAKRTTRLNSKAQMEKDQKILQLKKTRDYYTTQLRNIQAQLSDKDSADALTKNELNMLLKRIDTASSNIDDVHINLMIEADEAEPLVNEKDEKDLNDLVIKLKATLLDRLGPENSRTVEVVPQGTKEAFKIEIQQTDGTGNIPNTWGTFNGDRTKWKSFRDHWLAAMHENKNVKAVTKIRNLQAAMKDNALGVLDEFDVTGEDYFKAWKKLNKVYDDNYMQAQSFMQLLFNLPQLNGSSSKSIRNTIDTVQKALNGLKPYMKGVEISFFAVFLVIERMDSETFRAWEKYRPALCKKRDNPAEAAVDGNPNEENIGNHIPTWAELTQFLEGEALIRVHDEKRNPKQVLPKKFPQKQPLKRSNNTRSRDEYPDFMQCVLCVGIHPVSSCEAFIAMNYNGRLNHVTHHNLCVKCLRDSHNDQCLRKRFNEPCRNCKGGENKYHHHLLCPNSAGKMGITLAAKENRPAKRKFQNRQRKSGKRQRSENPGNSQQSDLRSGVHKVGEWAVMPYRSNAIGSVRHVKMGKSEFTILLATINIKIQTDSDKIVIC